MTKKKNKTIDVSPKILRVVSIISIVLIIAISMMDLIYNNALNYRSLIPLILLLKFCEYFRKF